MSKIFLIVLTTLNVLAATVAAASDDDTNLTFAELSAFPNPSGFAATYSTQHRIDLSNPFFQSLGSNGRSCNTCHQQDQGWTVSPPQIMRRFDTSAGTDPIFRLNDGANSPLADIDVGRARDL
jgi:cytochrome c peroxidase